MFKLQTARVVLHCYSGDVLFLCEKKWKILLPVQSKLLNRLSQNLSVLITSARKFRNI